MGKIGGTTKTQKNEKAVHEKFVSCLSLVFSSGGQRSGKSGRERGRNRERERERKEERERERKRGVKKRRWDGEFSALASKEKTVLVTDDESFWLF